MSTGAEPGLDDVRAEAPDDARPPRRARARIAATTALKSAAARMSRQRRRATPRMPLPGTYGLREVRRVRLARARRQRIGAHAGQIELFVAETSSQRDYTMLVATPNFQLASSARQSRRARTWDLAVGSRGRRRVTGSASRRRSCRTGSARATATRVGGEDAARARRTPRPASAATSAAGGSW